jgi:copper resistance protein C
MTRIECGARRWFFATATGLAVAAPSLPARTMEMVEQSPKVSEIVDGSAIAFALRFDGPLDHQRSRLTLVGPRGERELRPRLDAQPNTLYSAIGRLEPGDYRLRWTCVTRNGEMMSGDYPFTVR